MLADFCFADLLLLAPEADGDGWLVLGQIRPTTGPTMYRADWVGEVLPAAERPLVAEAWRTGRIVVGEMAHSGNQRSCVGHRDPRPTRRRAPRGADARVVAQLWAGNPASSSARISRSSSASPG